MNNLAVQLYTLREDKRPFPDLLTKVKQAGYSGIELTGPHGLSAQELKVLADDKGLSICSAHVLIEKLEHALDYVVAFHKEIGNDTLIVPWLAPAERNDWPKLAARLNAIYENLRPFGMKLLYHNHDFEMVDVAGKTALELVAEHTNPEIGFELDLAWISIGGQNAVEFIERFSGRVPRLHFKDAATDKNHEGGLADVGAGTLDWSSIIPAAKAAGAEWFVVEHDFPTDPLASITASASFLKDKL